MTIHKENGNTRTGNGDLLSWNSSGNGPSMMIMNGLMSSVEPHWTKWIRHYRDRFSVLTWDYRGHGASAEPGDFESISMEQFADDGAAVLTSSRLPKPVVLCGLSMGVQTALEFTRRYPDDVRAIVLLCGTAGHALNYMHPSPLFRSAITQLVRRFDSLPPRLFRAIAYPFVNTPIGKELSYRAGGVVRGKTSSEEISAIIAHVTGRHPRVFSRIVASYLNHTTWDMLPDITVPTLIIAGDRDDLVPISTAKEMHRRIAGSELHIVHGHGHLAQVEKPDEVHSVVDAFIAKHGLINS